MLPALCAALVLGFASCDNKGEQEMETKYYTVTFDDVELGKDGYWNGSDMSGKFTSGVCDFINDYTEEYASWMGFACSSLADTLTAGMGNQYSVMAGEGANQSRQFAVACFDGATLNCAPNEFGAFQAESVWLTNSTYAYLAMKNGDDFTKVFGEGDWFKVTLTGYLGENETGSIDYYLADFREGKAFISNQWEKVDISALEAVDKITLSFDSSDKGEWGMNNPAYVCMDDLLFTQTVPVVE